PEPELAAPVGDDLVGHQDQVGERPREAAGASGQPAVELPADPLGHDRGHPPRRVRRPSAGRGRVPRFARAMPRGLAGGTRGTGERVGTGREAAGRGGGGVVAPDPGEGLAPVGLGLDAEAGAGQAELVEAGGPRGGRGGGGGGGGGGAGGAARVPGGPKGVARPACGSAARSPRVRRPRRTSRSARSGRSRVATGSGARKARLPPGGTMAWWRAASPAAKVPSAVPTRHPPRLSRGATPGRAR